MGVLQPITATQSAGRRLRLFDEVPHGHGVLAVRPEDACGLLQHGDVVVYDEGAPSLFQGLTDGGMYVIEYQRPRSGMSWDLFRQHKCTRVMTFRHIIIAAKSNNPNHPDDWWAHPLCGSGARRNGAIQCSDGPYEHVAFLADKLIGEVVGIYNPAAMLPADFTPAGQETRHA